MTNLSVRQQVELASVVASLYRGGHQDVASDVVASTASYVGRHVMFDDTNFDSVFMRTLHELLDDLGFESIMKLSKKEAEKIAKQNPLRVMDQTQNAAPSTKLR